MKDNEYTVLNELAKKCGIGIDTARKHVRHYPELFVGLIQRKRQTRFFKMPESETVLKRIITTSKRGKRIADVRNELIIPVRTDRQILEEILDIVRELMKQKNS